MPRGKRIEYVRHDEIIGYCDPPGCGRALRRPDGFITTLDQHLYCAACWQKDIEKLKAKAANDNQ